MPGLFVLLIIGFFIFSNIKSEEAAETVEIKTPAKATANSLDSRTFSSGGTITKAPLQSIKKTRHPLPDKKPQRTQAKKEVKPMDRLKTRVGPVKKSEIKSQSKGFLGNLTPKKMIQGIIISEILAPPKSKR